MRLIQHKKEAFWFYRFLSIVDDRWVNPLFWTPEMRDRALEAARLDRRDLDTVDVGAGTGFTTEGIVARVAPSRVTMLDQSPHQLARARDKPALAACRKLEGDAEDLPFETDRFDRYVSAGSIEYWPDPQRAIAEAYRVLAAGGAACVIGPLTPANRAARALARVWMLFPTEAEYRAWFQRAGFSEIDVAYVAPGWYRGGGAPYGLAITGTKPSPGPSPLQLPPPAERADEPWTPVRALRFAGRFVVGSLAGLAFVPVAGALALRARLAARRSA